MNTRKLVMVVAVAAMLMAAGAAAETPSSTAFTYQGELRQEGGLANGLFDLELELYDLPTEGNLLGRVAVAEVEVKDGAFTVLVDFGLALPACGVDRFLETHVRPAGGNEYTKLSPRQPLKAKTDCTVDGTLTITALLRLPDTAHSGSTPTAGVLFIGDEPFLHSGGPVSPWGQNQVFVGPNAGNFTMGGTGEEGSGNVGVGWESLHRLTTGARNSALGTSAGDSLETADSNTALGWAALQANVSGDDNTAVGASALSTTQSYYNTAVGAWALHSNTWASDNTAVGRGALISQSYDNGGVAYVTNNTAIGVAALANNNPSWDPGWERFVGSDNTALGSRSLEGNSSGFGNTALGVGSLGNNTTGSMNTAVGARALWTQSYDPGGAHLSYNTAVGYEALYNNQSGVRNVAVGSYSQYLNSAGESNTAVGAGSLNSNSAGMANTAVGDRSLLYLESGSHNIAIGYHAGYQLWSGSSNILIGNQGQDLVSNTIFIGNSADHTSTYIAGIYGRPGGGTLVYVNSAGKLNTTSSSRRYKHDIVDMGDESDVLMQLRPVAFYFRPEIDPDQVRQYGLVAEEVVEVAPDLIIKSPTGEPESVRYDQVNAMLLNEVQKQRREIEKLEARLAAVEAQLEALAGGATSAE